MNQSSNKIQFAFQKRNYILLLIGIAIVIIGFMLMAGGGSEDPNVFKGDYLLTEVSLTTLSEEFGVDQSVVDQVSAVKDEVFPGEDELMTKLKDILGEEAYQKNYFALRSATEIRADMFSPRRITVAPITALIGYAFILYAILYKGRRQETA